MPNTLRSMMHPAHVPLETILNQAPYEDKRPLNDRELAVVRGAKRQRKVESGVWVIDVSKSEERASSCLHACLCLVLNSQPYRETVGKMLGPLQVLALQGIWQVGRPHVAQTACDSPRLLRDIAGNAFTSTVALSVCLAVLVHARSEEARGSSGGPL